MDDKRTGYTVSITVFGTEIDLDALRYFIPLTIPAEELSVTGDGSHAVISCITPEPWRVMEYCATVGEMDDIRIERKE